MDGGRTGSGSGSSSGSNTGTCPFLRRQSVKRSFSTMAETRRSNSPDSLFVSQDHHYTNEHAAQRYTPLALPPTARRSRYVGDGLDYRRPATTVAGMGSNVIDLTLEDDTRNTRIVPEASLAAVTPEPGPSRAQQRLPNFPSRNIIVIESDVEHEGQEREALRASQRRLHSEHHNRRREHHPAPQYQLRDIGIMNQASSNSTTTASSRTLPRPWEFGIAQRSITPHPTGSSAHRNNTIDLTVDDDDDVVLTEIRPRVPSQLNTVRPETTAGTGTRAVIDAMIGRTAAAAGVATEGIINRVFGMGHAGAGRGVAMDPDFNYMAVAFQLGGVDPLRPPTPQYEAPPKAEPGFTRSPGEDEEVVCPNCGDELCMGDNDIKQQVWVIKACGHAYCGECAHSRTARKPRTAKGKGKAKEEVVPSALLPLKTCQVVGCRGGNTGGKAMLRVYVDG